MKRRVMSDDRDNYSIEIRIRFVSYRISSVFFFFVCISLFSVYLTFNE